MIWDWKEAGERVLREGRLPEDGYYEIHRKKTLEIAAMRVMIGGGLDEDDARLMWASLDNGTFADVCALYGPMTVERVFLGEWRKAKSLGPFTGYARSRITNSEVEYLSRIPAPYEIRRYWAGLLCWVKARLAAGERPEVRDEVRKWIWGTVNPDRKWGNARKGVDKWSARCGRVFPVILAPKGGKMVSIWTAPWADPVDAKTDFGSPKDGIPPSDCAIVADAISRSSFICPECGRTYDWDGNGKHSGLCPICQIRRNEKLNSLRVRKNRMKKSSDE